MHQKINILKEHDKIRDYIAEIEVIADAEEVNYSNLIHVFKQLQGLWNSHEDREEKFFKELHEKGYDFPLEKFHFEHLEMKGYFKAMKESIESRNESEVIASLDTDAKMFANKMRKHMEEEELYLKNLKEK